MTRSSLLFLTLAAALAPSAAPAASGLCAAAQARLDKDADLARATAVAFPHLPVVHRDDGCRYPLQVLRYGDADVLISIGNTPGEACHGCSAVLSADVLDRVSGRVRVVARFERFGERGTSGDPGRIAALRLAGHDALAIESGGMFQGYSASDVAFYVFHDHRLVEVKPAVPLSASNAGAVEDKDAISIDGAWHVRDARADAVTADYAVATGGRTRRASATWALVGDALVRKAGRVPPEFDNAAGR